MSLRSLLVSAVFFFGASAWSHGGLVGAGPIELEAARTIVVLHSDKVQIISQVRYLGTPDELVWLLAIPNFNDPVEDGVRIEAFGQGGFDELDGVTRPALQGICDDTPNGQEAEISQVPVWGPETPMPLPSRTYNAAEVANGDLLNYLQGFGWAVDEATQAVITQMLDQNFMFVVVRVTTADLGVNKIDPTVSITYPLALGEQPKLPLLPSSLNANAGPADLVVWTMAGQKLRANLNTTELDAANVAFTAPGEANNYNAAFDAQVGANQTQTFITEYANGLDGFTNPALTQLVADSGAVFLTRLRVRMSAPALRANRIVSLREAGMGPIERALEVDGFNCGGAMPDPDMGVGPETDGGEPEVDGGDSPDADGGGGADGGVVVVDGGRKGGGGGGSAPLCSARPGNSGWPLLFLFFLLPLRSRRR